MKCLIRLCFISILCITIFGCKSKKSASATNTSQSHNTNTSNTPPAIDPASTQIASPKEEGIIRFIVSFYSAGEGIDVKIKDEFVQFLTSYPKKTAYEIKKWGREGEVDYLLQLSELTPTEQSEFVKKSNEILSKSKLVNVKENSKNDHAGWPALPNTVVADDTYRLVVSFYSQGEGIDINNKEEFKKFLNNQPKKISFEPTTWGREGEVDYCLKLNELSASEQMDFIRKAKELISKSKLVHVNENAKCVNKH